MFRPSENSPENLISHQASPIRPISTPNQEFSLRSEERYLHIAHSRHSFGLWMVQTLITNGFL